MRNVCAKHSKERRGREEGGGKGERAGEGLLYEERRKEEEEGGECVLFAHHAICSRLLFLPPLSSPWLPRYMSPFRFYSRPEREIRHKFKARRNN